MCNAFLVVVKFYICIDLQFYTLFIFLFFSWDEWVPETRILKYNETNLQKQKELIKTHV